MSFTISSIEKSPFQAIKKKSSKSPKIHNFPTGLKHGFRPKMVIFPTLFFQAIQARKMTFAILQNEKSPFQAIKTRSSEVEKLTFFQRGKPMVLVQKWPFFHLFFFLDNIGREKNFCDILERENAFLGYKNKNFKKSKN